MTWLHIMVYLTREAGRMGYPCPSFGYLHPVELRAINIAYDEARNLHDSKRLKRRK